MCVHYQLVTDNSHNQKVGLKSGKQQQLYKSLLADLSLTLLKKE